MSVKPISPSEIGSAKINAIPDFVIEAVNKLIVKNCSHGDASIYQDEIIQSIMATAAIAGIPLTREMIFEQKYLDFEDVYRANGWSVEYDMPGYSETYEPMFKFTAEK